MRLIATFLTVSIAASAGTYYLDCGSGSDEAAGTAPGNAWRTLARAADASFMPGDSLLLRRGTSCSGSLSPKGSGKDGNPIRIGAYGTGRLPVIIAGAVDAAVKLFDQEYWEIENIETSGGSPYGVYIGGSPGRLTLRHFQLRNLVVHDVGGDVKQKASGLVVIAAPQGAALEDVVVDGVTAYNTTQWAGIYVSGSTTRARGVVVRNSIVHDVYGDGIVLFLTENGRIEKSAAWLTGLQPTETIGTPSAIWTWSCRSCVVENTEGFWVDSPGVDGGVYDIDWGNDDNIVQYNYGHDAQGYCLAIFGAGRLTTTNSTIRYNVCVNNGRSPKLASRQGDLYLSTWEGGSLDGVQIHNNTFVWNPPVDAPAVNASTATFTGKRPNLVANNLFLSTVPSMVVSVRAITFQRNLYWHIGHLAPQWILGGDRSSGFDAYRTTAPEERYAAPKTGWLLQPLAGSPLIAGGVRLPDPGERDAFGAALPAGGARSIGAIEVQPPRAPSTRAPASLPRSRDRWLLLLVSDNPGDEARTQLVFMQAALAQYGDEILDAAFAAAPDEFLEYDWNLGDVRRWAVSDVSEVVGGRKWTALLLISPDGEIARQWNGFATPAEMGLTLKHFLGPGRANPELQPDRRRH